MWGGSRWCQSTGCGNARSEELSLNTLSECGKPTKHTFHLCSDCISLARQLQAHNGPRATYESRVGYATKRVQAEASIQGKDAPVVFVRSFKRPDCLHYKWTVRHLLDMKIDFWLLLAQGDPTFPQYIVLAIKLGILSRVLVAIKGASEVVTFAETTVKVGQHICICDDNIKGFYIAQGTQKRPKRQVPLKATWMRAFFKHAWQMMLKNGVACWGVGMSCNPLCNPSAMMWQDTHFAQSVERGLLAPDFGSFMLYGACFGLRKIRTSFPCKLGGLTDDIERSIRYAMHSGSRRTMTFPSIRVAKKVTKGGLRRANTPVSVIDSALDKCLDLLRTASPEVQKHVLSRCKRAKSFERVKEAAERFCKRRKITWV